MAYKKYPNKRPHSVENAWLEVRGAKLVVEKYLNKQENTINTNIKISLSDDERNVISNIYHNKTSSKLASRKEVTELVELFIQQLIDGDGSTYETVAPKIIREGYRYFMNDLEVSAERFHAITEAQRVGDITTEIEMKKE